MARLRAACRLIRGDAAAARARRLVLASTALIGLVAAQPARAQAPAGAVVVTGDVSFSAGSVLPVAVDAAGRSDRIEATGRADLRGGTVQVLAEPGRYGPLTSYTILTAARGVAGRFDGATTSAAFLTPTLSYDTTRVRLELARNAVPFAAVALSPNQRAVGGAVEALGFGDPVHDAVLAATARDARAAFDGLSGEVHATALATAVATSRLARDAVLARMRGPLAGEAGRLVPAAYAADRPGEAPAASMVTVRTIDPRAFGLWGQGFGSWGRTDGDGNAAGTERSTGGFLLGADATFEERWRVGFAGGYSGTTFEVTDRLSSGRSQSVNATLYAAASFGAAQIRLGASGALDRYETGRSVVFEGFGDSLRARYDGSTLQAFGEVGYRVGLGPATVEPFLGASVLRVGTERFVESGGPAALVTQASVVDLGHTTVGLRGEASLGEASPVALRAMLGWRHAFGEVTPTTLVAFRSGGPSVRVAGLPVDRDSLVAEAGLDWRVTDRATIGIGYTGAVGARSQDHGVRGSVDIRF